jgi:hypothetical protein
LSARTSAAAVLEAKHCNHGLAALNAKIEFPDDLIASIMQSASPELMMSSGITLQQFIAIPLAIDAEELPGSSSSSPPRVPIDSPARFPRAKHLIWTHDADRSCGAQSLP